MNSFETLNLPLELVKTLETMKITVPTPIQERSIPVILEGKDLLASAQTGTGKTLAYALPLATKLMQDPKAAALVLVPTRELAVQVKTTLTQILAKLSSLKIAVLIGGEPMFKQLTQLKAQPRIIVGTPGRINDHLNRKSLKLGRTNFIVIDEADRMLDMGFGIQLDQITDHLPEIRQTVMFSATLLPAVIKVSEKYLKNPEYIKENPNASAAPKINQQIIHTSSGDKFGHLLKELNDREGSIIVFVKTKRGADHLADKLRQEDQSADAIHGDLRQRQRDKVIRDIRQHKSRILVATDIAARGLDIPHIRHVINYDLPHCAEDYIHRIGRTARAGQEGDALCLIAPEDNKYWRAIHQLMNPGEKFVPSPAANRSRRGDSRPDRFQDGPRRFKPSDRFKNQDRPQRPEGARKRNDFKGSDGFSENSSPRRSETFNSNDKPRSFKRSDGFSENSSPRRLETFNSNDKPRSFKRSDGFSENSSPRRSDTFNSNDKPRSFKRSDGFSENSSSRRSDTFNSNDKPRSFKGPKESNRKFGSAPSKAPTKFTPKSRPQQTGTKKRSGSALKARG